MNKKPTKEQKPKYTWSRFNGHKIIAWHPGRQVYLHYSCRKDTKSRFDSWVGTITQFKNMKEVFPAAEGFIALRDGEEKSSQPPGDLAVGE